MYSGIRSEARPIITGNERKPDQNSPINRHSLAGSAGDVRGNLWASALSLSVL